MFIIISGVEILLNFFSKWKAKHQIWFNLFYDYCYNCRILLASKDIYLFNKYNKGVDFIFLRDIEKLVFNNLLDNANEIAIWLYIDWIIRRKIHFQENMNTPLIWRFWLQNGSFYGIDVIYRLLIKIWLLGMSCVKGWNFFKIMIFE